MIIMPLVVLPLPPDELRVNASKGRHWGKIQQAKDDYRLEAWPEIDAQRREWEGVPVHWPTHLYLTAYLGKGQRVDPSDVGTWCKFALDLLVEAGAFPDDNASRIRPFTVDVQRDARNPRIVFAWATGITATT